MRFMKKQRIIIFFILSLIVSLYVIEFQNVYAETIEEQIKNVHKGALNISGRNNFNNQCDDYVYYKLRAMGIFSSKESSGTYTQCNGNSCYGLYSKINKTSMGYLTDKYPGSNALDNLSNNGKKDVYNIVVSYHHQYDMTDDNPGAGHVALIHAIKGGYVYLSENYAYNNIQQGQPIKIKYSSFKSSWNSMYGYTMGAVVFSDPSSKVISNPKATNITSNGARIECDVNPAKTLKAVQVTVWSDVQGIDKHQWITKASSISGNHYIFDMKVSNFNYQRGLYKANIHVFYTDGTKDITTSPIQFTIPNPAVISNAKATNISNRGASIECDINPAKTLNVVQVTVWSDVQGIDKHQWITKATSISGNHYVFDMKVSSFNNQRGLYKANIHVFYTDGTKDITTSPIQFTIPNNSAPLAVLDVIRSEDYRSIHIAGWAFDRDEPSKSIEIHVYVGKPAGTAGAIAIPVKADKYRKDVNDAYRITGSHGYDLTINTSISGNQTVYLYAIDSQGGNNPCFKEVKVDIKDTHQMEWFIKFEPRCEAKGIKIRKCKVCGMEDTDRIIFLDSLGHDWDSGIITTKATCTEAGEKTYTCQRCGKTKSESIDAIGHEWEKYGKSYPCEETHHYICKNCGVLSYEKGPFVGAKEHTIVIDKAIEPTYTKTGLTEGSHCSVCGKVIVKQNVIPVLAKKTTTTKTTTTKPTTTKSTTTKPTTTKPTKQQTVSEKPKEIVGVGTISSDGTTLTDVDGIKYYVSEKLTNDKLSKGISLADKKSAGKYKITKIIKTNGKVTGGTVTYMKPYNKNCITANVKVSIIISGAKFKVTAIAKKAFMGCKSLTKVTIKKNVKYIGNSAFENCTSLKTVICKSVRLTKIGERVFCGDKNLKRISFKSTQIKKIGKNAFRRINKRAKISVPKKRLKKYKKMIKNAGAPKKVKIKK